MAENPLLPDEELRRLHRLLKQAAGPPARTSAKPGSSTSADSSAAALAVSSSMQLAGTDVLVLPHAFATPRGLVRGWRDASLAVSTVPPGLSPLTSAAAVASAQQARSDQSLVLALLESSHDDAAWASALRWAQEQTLPLVVVLIDRSGQDSMQRRSGKVTTAPGWPALDRLCRELQLPVLTVDGQDAVACYRVMQESALRARAGGGPAVLWAVLPRPDDTGKAAARASLRQLTTYMKVRRISLR